MTEQEENPSVYGKLGMAELLQQSKKLIRQKRLKFAAIEREHIKIRSK